MKLITMQEMNTIVSQWRSPNDLAPEGRFYGCTNKGVWVGCDNSSGDCWVEEFKTEEDVIKWLNDEFVYDVNGHPLNEWAEENQQANDVHQQREAIYDELCALLTNYEERNDVYPDDLYDMLVKIQNNWETVITVQND